MGMGPKLLTSDLSTAGGRLLRWCDASPVCAVLTSCAVSFCCDKPCALLPDVLIARLRCKEAVLLRACDYHATDYVERL
jgi:hypothetical protein